MWQNVSGTRQAKLVPREIYELADEDQCICLPLGCMYFPAYTDMIPESFGYPEPLKNIRLLPVKGTYRRLPWTKNQGIVFGRFVYHPQNEPFEGCPRNLFDRAVGNLRDLGYSLKVGIELEFEVRHQGTLEPIEDQPYSNANSLDQYSEDFATIYSYIKGMGVKL